MPRHVTPTHKIAMRIPGLSYVGSLSLRAAFEQSPLFVLGGVISGIKGALLGGSFNHRQTIWIVSAPNKSRKKRFFSELENSRRLLST